MPYCSGALKQVEGRFGGNTRSVFAFPLLLVSINLCLGALFVVLLALPATLSDGHVSNILAKIDLDTILGGDGLEDTPFFYSGYSQQYSMWGAVDWKYCLIVIFFYAGSGIFAILRLGTTTVCEAEEYQAHKIDSHPWCHAVWGGWSMGLNHMQGVKENRYKAAEHWNELLSLQHYDAITKEGKKSPLLVAVTRTIGSVVYAAYLLGILYVVGYFVRMSAGADNGNQYIVPYVMAAINWLSPAFIKKLSVLEKWHANMALKMDMGRIYMMKMSLLLYAMFEYYDELASSGKLTQTQCVEAEIGKLFWRLLVSEVIAVFLWDGILWDLGKYCVFRKKDEVELAMLVIDFLGTQCLVWIGTPYCPMLPLLGAFNLTVKFYVQKTLLINLQKAPKKYLGAGNIDHFLTQLLTLTLALTLAPGIFFLLTPSACGPFAGLAGKAKVSLVPDVIVMLFGETAMGYIAQAISPLPLLVLIVLLLSKLYLEERQKTKMTLVVAALEEHIEIEKDELTAFLKEANVKLNKDQPDAEANDFVAMKKRINGRSGRRLRKERQVNQLAVKEMQAEKEKEGNARSYRLRKLQNQRTRAAVRRRVSAGLDNGGAEAAAAAALAHQHNLAGHHRAAAETAVAFKERTSVQAPIVPAPGPAFLPSVGLERPPVESDKHGRRLRHDMEQLAGAGSGKHTSKPERITHAGAALAGLAPKVSSKVRKKKSISGDL